VNLLHRGFGVGGQHDAEGQGRVAYLSRETVRWLKVWLEHAQIREAAVFRRLIGRDQIGGVLNAGERCADSDFEHRYLDFYESGGPIPDTSISALLSWGTGCGQTHACRCVTERTFWREETAAKLLLTRYAQIGVCCHRVAALTDSKPRPNAQIALECGVRWLGVYRARERLPVWSEI
jgi:hypothetical protein